MGRRVIQIRYRPVEGVAPAHVLRAFTAAVEDQGRPPGQRDDETVDLGAIAERAGAGAVSIVPGSASSQALGDGDEPVGLLLEFAVLTEDGADPDAVEDGCRRFATAALQRRLGGRTMTELSEVTLDLDQARIDLTEQGAALPPSA